MAFTFEFELHIGVRFISIYLKRKTIKRYVYIAVFDVNNNERVVRFTGTQFKKV